MNANVSVQSLIRILINENSKLEYILKIKLYKY